MNRLRVLHAIHDFLPRHLAGSEIYAYELARALSRKHDVWMLAAEYDLAANHGQIRWRRHEDVAVVEVVNNWEFRGFDETYASPRLNRQIEHVLHAVRPDVVHVHNLLNLSFDLPALAHARGARVVATLHDYTLVCPSGGQRIHRADRHVCDTIDVERCARCFGESPFGAQLAVGRTAARFRGRPLLRAADAVRRRLPVVARAAARYTPGVRLEPDDIRARLAYAQHVFRTVDLFVAPSATLAREFVRLGVPPSRIEVSENGSAVGPDLAPRPERSRVAVGFVGSIVWHKGVHVLIEAARRLRGDFDVRIFGDPCVAPDYTRDLERMAEGLPVRFEGAFDRATAAAVYRGIDVLVVPSLWPENAPLVLQEASLHGVAVVAARVGGIPEFVTDGVNGLLYDATSANELAAALQRLIDDPPLRASLAAVARPVKSIVQDAEDWERRYHRVLQGQVGPLSVSV